VSSPFRGIFIVGTGRSGTHFLCRLLLGFAALDDLFGGNEDRRTLASVATAAILHRRLPARTIRLYEERVDGCARRGRILLDQHHPNLFHVDQLKARFGDLLFLHPSRPTIQIVASMLKHKGVGDWYAWIRKAGDIPYPNQFFGLAERSELLALPPHLLCARRVIAHKRRAAMEAARDPEGFRQIDFVALVRSPHATLSGTFRDQELAQLGGYRQLVAPDPGVLGKFADVLTSSQVDEIVSLESRELADPESAIC
jgi:hypothetical protein